MSMRRVSAYDEERSNFLREQRGRKWYFRKVGPKSEIIYIIRKGVGSAIRRWEKDKASNPVNESA